MCGRLHGELGLLSPSATLSLSLSSWAPPLRLPPLWQAINASNEPTAHCHLGQMLWEGTAFLSTPHRTALEEATAPTLILSN